VRYAFEDYVIDSDRRELTRSAEPIAVGPQVFDLLLHLLRNREHVVSKDELLDAVWAGRIVSESTLTSHINAARKAIGDSGQNQRLLRTIARKGFRFVGDVSEIASRSAAVSTEPDAPGKTIAEAPALPDRPSIAALPFLNLSGDIEQEYFTDGVVEDIITALSRIRWLFVIARNSSFTYKGRAVDVKQVGRELGVRYVLEGSVRKAAHKVRITGQLIDATTGRICGPSASNARSTIFSSCRIRSQRPSSARSRRSSSGPRSSARSASQPKASTPTTTICAAWRTSIWDPGSRSTWRSASSTMRSCATRISRRPTRWRRGAISGARSTAG
jgi:TolB-like protein